MVGKRGSRDSEAPDKRSHRQPGRAGAHQQPVEPKARRIPKRRQTSCRRFLGYGFVDRHGGNNFIASYFDMSSALTALQDSRWE